MNILKQYIENLKMYIKARPNLTENMIVRYVYWDLGNRFGFDPDFYPFGNKAKKKAIYNQSLDEDSINECMERNTIVCRTAAKALEIILSEVGIDIETSIDYVRKRDFQHYYNIIYPKDGSEPYSIDLQDDIYRIQMHAFPQNFGRSLKNEEEFIIPRVEQERMDRELGYIDSEHYYSDEYLYLLKHDISFMDSFEEKVEFVLENIEFLENPNMQYTDRQWYHVRLLEQLFSRKDFDYDTNQGKINMIDCYKEINGNRILVNCVVVQSRGKNQIYVYNKSEAKYSKIDIKFFARAVKNGLVVYNGKVPGLGGALKSIKDK